MTCVQYILTNYIVKAAKSLRFDKYGILFSLIGVVPVIFVS